MYSFECSYSPSKNIDENKYNYEQYGHPLNNGALFWKVILTNGANFGFCIYFHRAGGTFFCFHPV